MNIYRDAVEVNIHRYSLRLRWITVLVKFQRCSDAFTQNSTQIALVLQHFIERSRDYDAPVTNMSIIGWCISHDQKSMNNSIQSARFSFSLQTCKEFCKNRKQIRLDWTSYEWKSYLLLMMLMLNVNEQPRKEPEGRIAPGFTPFDTRKFSSFLPNGSGLDSESCCFSGRWMSSGTSKA